MFKKLNENNKGGIAPQTIIVIAVILTAAIIGFYYLFIKIDKTQTNMEQGLKENYLDNDLVVNVRPPKIKIENEDDDIDNSNNGDLLISDDKELKRVTFTQVLEKNKDNIRALTVTLPSLDSILDIRVNNGGTIEVLSVDGEEVTIRIKDGNPVDYIVVSGEYVPYGEKYITAYLTSKYIDEEGYEGTLTKYTYQVSPAQRKPIEILVEGDTTNFPNTQPYKEGEYSTTLTKNGAPLTEVIKGSALHSKEVTKQELPNYVETLNDNQIETAYTGTLKLYVDSGMNSIVKVETKIITNKNNNSFPSNYEYSDNEGFKGTLAKSGNPVAVIDKGSISTDKFVTAQTTSNYLENLNDNGIETSYTGILTKYVYQGSDSITKSVTNQKNKNHSEYINDNGVGTYYTGILTEYVTGGYTPDSKTYSKIVTSSNTNFSNTINVQDGLYVGTIEKNGNYRTYSGGSASVSKYVSGQSSSWYNDGSYSGSLSQYLASGSAAGSKYVTGQTSNYYNDGTYSGSLSQYLASGSAGDSKYVTGQTSSYYNNSGYSGYLSPYYVERPGTWVYVGHVSSLVNPTSTSTRREECQHYYHHENYIEGYACQVYVTQGGGTDTFYQGTVTKPDTRVYTYAGTVYKPDTRSYAYQGTVWTADTRYKYYEQTYIGTINRPDSRTYAFRGEVTKPDTRIYRYQGTVTKPDTRIYVYNQQYTGEVKTEDKRVWRYKGTVTKPDTRVYKYTQKYNGTLYIPEKCICRYQGKVIRKAIDNRQIDYLYQYNFEIDYFQK